MIAQRHGHSGTWLPVSVDRHPVQVVQRQARGGERVPDTFGFALVMAWNCSLANGGTGTSWVGGVAQAADVAGQSS